MPPRATPARSLRVLAAGAPFVFTLAWLVLGALTPGFSGVDQSISSIAQLGAPLAAWMAAAFVLQGLGQCAGAVLAWRTPQARLVAASLALAGAGTIGVGAFPLPGPDGPNWLGSAHSVFAAAAFLGLHLAAATAAASSAVPRWLRGLAVLALAVALPNLAFFLAHLGRDGTWFGGSERAFVTVLIAWCAALAWWRTAE